MKLFKKFPEPTKNINKSYWYYYSKSEVDECLKQHIDEWNTIRRKVRKLNTEDGWSLMYNAIIDYIEALLKVKEK